MDHKDTGRVSLSDFYRGNRDGMYQFAESVEYLRELGSLDDSFSSSPQVLISNWVWGVSNCIVTAADHNACCLTECGTIRSTIEEELTTPETSFEDMSDILSRI